MGIIIMSVTCFGQGEDYSSECSGTAVTLPATLTEANSKAFINEAISALAGVINMALGAFAGNLDDNLVKAALAGRCFLTSGATDTWRILLAVYYAARAFAFEAYVTDSINQYVYPSMCACKNMINSYAAMLGGSSANADKFSSCSEEATTAVSNSTSNTTNSSSNSSSSNSSNSSQP